MKTDSLFYTIFQELPFVFFALLGIPESTTNQYQFTSQELKQLALRLDGLFLPLIPNPELPLYIVEVQFQPDPNLYYRLFNELLVYLRQYQPPHPWRLVVIYPDRKTEQINNLHFNEFLQLPNITRIYINELTPTETTSLPVQLLKLITEPETTAPNLAVELASQARAEIADVTIRENLINLLETIIVYKLPQKSREEIAAMFNLSDLKQTRFYQEVFAEGEAEGEAKGKAEGEAKGKAEGEAKGKAEERAEAKRREQAAILRMSNQGLSIEEIATFLDLPLAEAAAIVQAAQSNQSEAN